MRFPMSFKLLRNILGTVMITAILAACGSSASRDSGNSALTRSFYMGFTPFPYDADPTTLIQVVDDVYAKLTDDADMVLHHLEEGIPWNAALADDMLTPASVTFPYTDHIKLDWDTRNAKTPASHKKYVAITPLNLGRESLAPWRNIANEQDLQPPFDTYAADRDLNADDVKTAYLNYSRRVIEYFQPDYLAIGIEVNLLRRNTDAATWAKYVDLNQYVYTQLKTEHPDLPIFVSVSAAEMLIGYVDPPIEFVGDAEAYQSTQLAILDDLLVHSDYYAISIYPFLTLYFASDFPAHMFSEIFSLSSKPKVIAETGMLAENMIAFSILFEGNPGKQDDYMQSMLAAANENDLLFVNWFVLQDYDLLCDYIVCDEEDAIWRDTGVYDGSGNPRPSHTSWKSYLNRSLR